MYLFYNFILTILSPIWVPWMWWRSAKRKEKPNWKERQGHYPMEPRIDGVPIPRVWVHAVSVGEVVASMPVLKEIRKVLPDHEIVLSVTTSSGHQTAREQVADLVDHICYFPLDIPLLQLRAMQKVQPRVVAIMETELWFNFLWAAKTFDAQTLLINGRISDRSYPRSRLLKFFYKALLQNMDRCLMQTQKDADRILALGAKSAEVFGNCKFDQAVEGLDADPQEWRDKLGLVADKPVIVIGSTRSEEEEVLVVEAIGLVGLERVSVVHAPRHLERAGALAEHAASKLGVGARRSLGETGAYLILDTYGELSSVYSVADIVVIGGGFSNMGGQNLIQPLAHGKPVLHGPHMQNFAEAAAAARACGATEVCAIASELAAAITRLLNDPAEAIWRGNCAREMVATNLGASERYAQAIASASAAFSPPTRSASPSANKGQST